MKNLNKGAIILNLALSTGIVQGKLNDIRTSTEKNEVERRLSITHAEVDKLDDEYILKVKDGVDLDPLLEAFEVECPFGVIIHKYTSVFNGFAVSGVTEEAVSAFANGSDDVFLEIVENAKTQKAETVDWGLDRIDDRQGLDDSYSSNFDGQGVTIFILDSGMLTSHNEFTGRVQQGIDFTGESVEGQGQFDGYGHGTHVAGIAAGTNYGVAPGATIVPVKVLDSSGEGTWADVVAGIDWVKAQHESSSSKRSVANLSIGGGKVDFVNNAIASAAEAGIVMVVAAGNEDQDACNVSPASAGAAITVGATNNTDLRASFSNFGSCVDIFAPGSDILSAGIESNSASQIMSGTSMASPFVAGAAALLLQADPRISGPEVAGILNDMATSDALSNLDFQSPNKLLYIGEIDQDNGWDGGGDEDNESEDGTSTPPSTSGKITFQVDYDAYPEETKFNIWQLRQDGAGWDALADYDAPTMQNEKRRKFTRRFEDGYYSFDLHDSHGDGLASGYDYDDYFPGSFELTETDTGRVLYQGADFKSYLSVEFEIINGAATVAAIIDW